MVDGDAAASYAFLSIGSKATNTLEQYQRKARLRGFQAAKVQSVTCEGELCKVAMSVTLDTRKMPGLVLPETETWILEKGQYWYVFPL